MHRTQISLEDDQYMALRERARRNRKSMGQFIRELLDRELSAKPESVREENGLYALEGSLKDSAAVAKNHDETLYGEKG